jgi:hypothetical protein
VCVGTGSDCTSTTVCKSGKCESCGGANEPCCSGGKCNVGDAGCPSSGICP